MHNDSQENIFDSDDDYQEEQYNGNDENCGQYQIPGEWHAIK